MTEPKTAAEQTTSASIKNKTSSFASDALKLISGATLAQAFTILISPVLSRIFAPEVFGIAAVFTSILAFVTVISCFRYELAIMLPKKDEDAANLFVGSLFLVGMVTVLIAFMTVFLGDSICRWLKAPGLKPFLWLLPIALFLRGSYLALQYWHTRSKRFGMLSVMRFAVSASQGTSKLSLGFLGQIGPGSLIGSDVLGATVSTVGLGWKTWCSDRTILRQTNWRRIVKILKRYRKFPLADSWSALLNTLSIQIPVILLSVFFSQTVVGYYSFGARLIVLPMGLVGMAVSQVFFQRASVAYNQGTLGQVMESTYKRLVNLGLFPMLVLGIIGPEIFIIVFGSQWAEAGVYTQIMCLWQFLVFIGSPLTSLFGVLERQGAGLIFNIVLVVSRILSLVIGGRLGSARLALGLYAGSGVVVWICLILWLFHVSHVSKRVAVFGPLPCLLYATPILLLLSMAKWWWLWSAWNILFIAGFGMLAYYMVVIWQDRSLREPVLVVLNRVWKKKR